MKVLFISEHSHIELGGIAKHISHIGNLINVKGIKVAYLNAQDLSQISILNKKIVSKKILASYLKSVAPTIIHLHGFSSFFVNLCMSISKTVLPNVKLIYTPHYHPFIYHTHPLFAKLFFHTRLRQNLKYIDTLITLSQTEKSFFEQYIDKHKIEIIPNGIEIDSTRFEKEKPHENKLLFIGRDDHNKRLDFLELQREYFQHHNIQCHIITDKEKISDNIFTYYTNLPSSELQNLYEKCTVLVVPSKYEAFSIVTLEAMSYGMPVLISSHVQIKSYFKDNENFNQVFNYDDQEDFQKKLSLTLNINPKLYREGSKENLQFTKPFEWKNIVERLLGVYLEHEEL